MGIIQPACLSSRRHNLPPKLKYCKARLFVDATIMRSRRFFFSTVGLYRAFGPGIGDACQSGTIIGVNISERKSGTERTKKRKKRELVCFPHRQGAQRSTSHIDQCDRGLHGFCPSYDNPGYLYPGPYAGRTKSQLNKQANTHNILQV